MTNLGDDAFVAAMRKAHPERCVQKLPQKDQIERKKRVVHRPWVQSTTITKRIISVICRLANLSENELKSNRRHKDLVYWRHIAGHLLRKHTTYSLPRIGNVLGGRDHSTVMNGFKKIDADYEKYRADIELVERSL